MVQPLKRRPRPRRPRPDRLTGYGWQAYRVREQNAERLASAECASSRHCCGSRTLCLSSSTKKCTCNLTALRGGGRRRSTRHHVEPRHVLSRRATTSVSFATPASSVSTDMKPPSATTGIGRGSQSRGLAANAFGFAASTIRRGSSSTCPFCGGPACPQNSAVLHLEGMVRRFDGCFFPVIRVVRISSQSSGARFSTTTAGRCIVSCPYRAMPIPRVASSASWRTRAANGHSFWWTRQQRCIASGLCGSASSSAERFY